MALKHVVRATALALVVLVTAGACGSESEGSPPGPSGSETPSPVVESDPGTDVGGSPAETSPDGGATRAAPTPPPIDAAAIRIESASIENFAPPPVPVSVTMEALGVDAPIIPVGIVEETGEMELPGASEVAWYRYAGRPGDDAGSVVIAAHVDWNGKPGPFFQLREAELGDDLDVVLDDGTTATYVVEQIVAFPKQELPAEYFRTDGPHQIVMITCGGDFNERERSYLDNIAVVAVPADRPPPEALISAAA